MDIGQPRRIIEVEPVNLPVPETIPEPALVPEPAPASEPAPMPERDPAEGSTRLPAEAVTSAA